MPIYEYECQSCGRRFELLQHFSDDPVESCPECGGSVRRLIQPVGIIFKGSGFYVTDNRQLPAGEAAKELPGGDGSKKKETKETQKDAASAKQ
jgi:putative FmdB family regulatory protein